MRCTTALFCMQNKQSFNQRSEIIYMKFRWEIYFLTLISFMVGTAQFVIASILDKVAVSVGVPVSSAGQLITAFALASAFGVPLVVMVSAKFHQRKQLLLALSIILTGIVAIIALPGFGFLIMSQIILGIGVGVYTVTACAIAVKLAPLEQRGNAVGTVLMGLGASLVIGIPVCRMIAAAHDWKLIFWGIGIMILVGIIVSARAFPVTAGDAPIPLGRKLAFLKKPEILIALGVTFLTFFGYSAVNTYIAPLLPSVMPLNERGISGMLLALGIASVIGSKAGGFFADRQGIAPTLLGSMTMQSIALLALFFVAGSTIIPMPLLMLWTAAAWSFGTTQNLNLVSLAPESSGIMLSLNLSVVSLGSAAGAGIGGLAISGFSILSITWIGAISVALATCVSLPSIGLARFSAKSPR